jgi:hypothetical protein
MNSTTVIADKHHLVAKPLPPLGNIQVLVGQEVMKVISDPEIIQQWDELYEQCSWATIFQSSQFVSCWYTHYADVHTPILVMSWHKGKLTGLLALADRIPDLGIAGAGGYDAYYHLWLSSPINSDMFITEALLALRKLFPTVDICLKYIPSNVSVRWITDHAALKGNCVIRQFTRPVLDVSQVNENDVVNRKQFREKYNRLKRLGEVSFEMITTPEEFERELQAQIDHYDFRKAATYDIMPFRDDRAKKPFLVELVKQGLLTAAVLKVNHQSCALITITTPSKGWIHGAGIVVHNPKFSRFTPGYVVIKLLCVWMKKYQDILYDITPGDHAYKNQHASTFDTINELRVTNPVKAAGLRTIYSAKREIKKILASRELQPAEAKEKLQVFVQAIKRPFDVVSNLTAGSKLKSMIVGRLQSSNQFRNKRMPFSRDNIADLLGYDKKYSKVPVKQFMREPLSLYERGNVLYTYTQDNTLKCVVWASLKPDQFLSADAVNNDFIFSEESILIHNFHTFCTHPNEKGELLDSLALQLQDEYPLKEIYVLLEKPLIGVNDHPELSEISK